MTNNLLLKMAIEVVPFPMRKADFPVLCKRLPEGSNMLNPQIHRLCTLFWQL